LHGYDNAIFKRGRIVISQSMYFHGLVCSSRYDLLSFFVHYDDVQLTRGFTTAFRLKTAQGSKWITVPLCDHHRGQNINEVHVDESADWRSQHRDILRQAYLKAPFRDEMLAWLTACFHSPLPPWQTFHGPQFWNWQSISDWQVIVALLSPACLSRGAQQSAAS